MPLSDFVQVDDDGIIIRVTVKENDKVTPVDLSTATSILIYLYRPDGALISGSATFTTDGSDGKIEYITQTNDLSVQGMYKIQARYMIGGHSKKTNTSNFLVEPNLPGVS